MSLSDLRWMAKTSKYGNIFLSELYIFYPSSNFFVIQYFLWFFFWNQVSSQNVHFRVLFMINLRVILPINIFQKQLTLGNRLSSTIFEWWLTVCRMIITTTYLREQYFPENLEVSKNQIIDKRPRKWTFRNGIWFQKKKHGKILDNTKVT